MARVEEEEEVSRAKYIYIISRERVCAIYLARARHCSSRKTDRERLRNSRRQQTHNNVYTCGGGVFANIILLYTRRVCTCVNWSGAPSGRGAPVQRDRRDDFDDDDTVSPPPSFPPYRVRPTAIYTTPLPVRLYIHAATAAAARKRIVNHTGNARNGASRQDRTAAVGDPLFAKIVKSRSRRFTRAVRRTKRRSFYRQQSAGLTWYHQRGGLH